MQPFRLDADADGGLKADRVVEASSGLGAGNVVSEGLPQDADADGGVKADRVVEASSGVGAGNVVAPDLPHTRTILTGGTTELGKLPIMHMLSIGRHCSLLLSARALATRPHQNLIRWRLRAINLSRRQAMQSNGEQVVARGAHPRAGTQRKRRRLESK